MSNERITLAHGAGGKLSQELMTKIILPAFGNPYLNELHDGARLKIAGEIAFTTDSYVINPLFFPGGNIGKLAVCGTVNDLAMTGAVPRYISAGVILEEGFPLEKLRAIVATMAATAKEAGVAIVTGDTKVVPKGACDGIFINTAGVGEIIPGVRISPKQVKKGMQVILSGYIGNHAAVITAGRHGLNLPPGITSDSAPLNHLTEAMLQAVPDIALLRDATRGGVAAVLNEIAMAASLSVIIREEAIPVLPEVAGVADMLGLDPLEMANEGTLVAFVPPAKTEAVLAVMREFKEGKEARLIGEVTDDAPGKVAMRTTVGGLRLIDMPLGELVPRIC
ncbi:MAG: hydrogenase expression/formation protein HypE [Selenomonadaceae bacterium]|nr:hydrogenase expression/formation protein HypE [Selenomonadaceae bacterium]